MVALRASQGRFAPMLRMTAGWEVSLCFLTYDYHKTIFLSVILSVRSPRSFLQSSKAAMRREQQKVEERSDEEIYKRLPQAFPRANELFRVHKRQKKAQACANILRREIRPCFASVALRVSQGRYAPMFKMTAGGCFAVGGCCGRPMGAPTRLVRLPFVQW